MSVIHVSAMATPGSLPQRRACCQYLSFSRSRVSPLPARAKLVNKFLPLPFPSTCFPEATTLPYHPHIQNLLRDAPKTCYRLTVLISSRRSAHRQSRYIVKHCRTGNRLRPPILPKVCRGIGLLLGRTFFSEPLTNAEPMTSRVYIP